VQQHASQRNTQRLPLEIDTARDAVGLLPQTAEDKVTLIVAILLAPDV